MFNYLIDRIASTPLRAAPFSHLYIADLFAPEHFASLVGSPEIAFGPCRDDGELFQTLGQAGFRAIDFPGCMTDSAAYRQWRARGGTEGIDASAIEGEFGMVFRLADPKTPILAGLLDFLGSPAFLTAIAARFDVDAELCSYDGGVQKYLDGYQISPHPDVRSKALTWMANIVPDTACAERSYHTRYMRLRPEFAYVSTYWKGNSGIDRAHLPWDVAECEWMHRENNSLVAFAPGDDSIHAVQAWYDHLSAQRTQIYGNLWSRNPPGLRQAGWPSLSIQPEAPATAAVRGWLASNAPSWLRDAVRARRKAPSHGAGLRYTGD